MVLFLLADAFLIKCSAALVQGEHITTDQVRETFAIISSHYLIAKKNILSAYCSLGHFLLAAIDVYKVHRALTMNRHLQLQSSSLQSSARSRNPVLQRLLKIPTFSPP